MNPFDAFQEDKHAITGSEPQPHDVSSRTQLIRSIYKDLRLYLYSSTIEMVDASSSSKKPSPIHFIPQLKELKDLWLSEFALYNENTSPKPCNMNDIISHLYYQLYYIQYHRSTQIKLELTCKKEYNYLLVIDACCALAVLAGCRHKHLFKPYNNTDVEGDQSWLDTIQCMDYPSIDDMNQFITRYHLGFINTWYYWRKPRVTGTNTEQWEIRQQLSLKIDQWMKKKQQEEDVDKKKKSNWELLIPPFVVPTSDPWLLQRCLHTQTTVEDKSLIEEDGFLWKRDGLSYIDRFLMVQNHVFIQIEMEHYLLHLYSHGSSEELTWTDYHVSRTCVFQWIDDWMSTAHTEGFFTIFKAILYEHLLPLGSRTYIKRAKTHDVKPDTLFKEMLGQRATIYVDELINSEIKRKHIAKTPTHPLYPYMILTILHYDLMQKNAIKSFHKTYLIKNTCLALKEDALYSTKTQGRTRTPLVVLLTGEWYIHTVYPIIQWYKCKDIIELIVTWFLLIGRQDHTNEWRLPDRRSVKWWADKFKL